MSDRRSDDDFADLEHRRWGQEPEPVGRFVAGFSIASLCSVLLWWWALSGSHYKHDWVAYTCIGFVLAKLSASAVMILIRNWRPAGLGILLSTGLEGLILLGICFAAFVNSTLS